MSKQKYIRDHAPLIAAHVANSDKNSLAPGIAAFACEVARQIWQETEGNADEPVEPEPRPPGLRDCRSCAHEHSPPDSKPCSKCMAIEEVGYSGWEPRTSSEGGTEESSDKTCDNCFYRDAATTDRPCYSCPPSKGLPNWRPWVPTKRLGK